MWLVSMERTENSSPTPRICFYRQEEMILPCLGSFLLSYHHLHLHNSSQEHDQKESWQEEQKHKPKNEIGLMVGIFLH